MGCVYMLKCMVSIGGIAFDAYPSMACVCHDHPYKIPCERLGRSAALACDPPLDSKWRDLHRAHEHDGRGPRTVLRPITRMTNSKSLAEVWADCRGGVTVRRQWAWNLSLLA